MQPIALDMYQSAAVGAAVLILGLAMVKRSETLRRFCIPAAVAGGMIFSVAMLLLHASGVAEMEFDDTLRDVSMRMFFCSIGFMASFRMLREGGRLVAVLVGIMALLVVSQNVLGIAAASAMGLDPKYGLALGSISLVGGHGTAAAYGGLLADEYGIAGADEVCIASATFGLAIAGFIGGPLGKRLVRKHGLKPDATDVEIAEESSDMKTDNSRFLTAAILVVLCLGAGTIVNGLASDASLVLPSYLGAMVIAFTVRNVADAKGYDLPVKEINTIGWVCLCVFLAMALMSIKLWQIADLATAMIVTLMLQTILLVFFAYVIVFRATGKSYESAALAAGVSGFGMGAVPNAVANMEALTKECGPAPVAYFVVPLMGGVFLDIINVAVLTVMLNIARRAGQPRSRREADMRAWLRPHEGSKKISAEPNREKTV